MNRKVLLLSFLVLVALSMAIGLTRWTAYADYPTECAAEERETPDNPFSPCKWETESVATSAEYMVEMEYPLCLHHLYLRGMSELPPGHSGSWRAWDIHGKRLHYDWESIGEPGSGRDYNWEVVAGSVRINVDPQEYQSTYSFSVTDNTPKFQTLIPRHDATSRPLGRLHVKGWVANRDGTGSYSVTLADLPAIDNLAVHKALTYSCHQQIRIEKQRREDLAAVEAQKAADDQALVVLQAEEQARLDANNARIAQEKRNTAERLRVTQEISSEIDASNQAWISELSEIKALEVAIQADLNQRTLASIESARTIKDEYIAIATLRLTETQNRVNLLNDWYQEELDSWETFEGLADQVWIEININEGEIEAAKSSIARIQTTFDQTVTAINARMEAFQREVGDRDTVVPTSTPTP